MFFSCDVYWLSSPPSKVPIITTIITKKKKGIKSLPPVHTQVYYYQALLSLTTLN